VAAGFAKVGSRASLAPTCVLHQKLRNYDESFLSLPSILTEILIELATHLNSTAITEASVPHTLRASVYSLTHTKDDFAEFISH
jgi:hypothetical protein